MTCVILGEKLGVWTVSCMTDHVTNSPLWRMAMQAPLSTWYFDQIQSRLYHNYLRCAKTFLSQKYINMHVHTFTGTHDHAKTPYGICKHFFRGWDVVQTSLEIGPNVPDKLWYTMARSYYCCGYIARRESERTCLQSWLGRWHCLLALITTHGIRQTISFYPGYCICSMGIL